MCQGCLAIYRYIKGYSERKEINYSYQSVKLESEVMGLSSYIFPVSQIFGENCKPVDTQAVELVKGAVDSSTGNSQGFD